MKTEMNKEKEKLKKGKREVDRGSPVPKLHGPSNLPEPLLSPLSFFF
jgi:hypothetical protein